MTLLEECRKNQNDWFEESKNLAIEYLLHEFGKDKKIVDIIYGTGWREFKIKKGIKDVWAAYMGECCASRLRDYLISEGFHVTTQMFGFNGNMQMLVSAY